MGKTGGSCSVFAYVIRWRAVDAGSAEFGSGRKLVTSIPPTDLQLLTPSCGNNSVITYNVIYSNAVNIEIENYLCFVGITKAPSSNKETPTFWMLGCILVVSWCWPQSAATISASIGVRPQTGAAILLRPRDYSKTSLSLVTTVSNSVECLTFRWDMIVKVFFCGINYNFHSSIYLVRQFTFTLKMALMLWEKLSTGVSLLMDWTAGYMLLAQYL
jgi:hypothetical protein